MVEETLSQLARNVVLSTRYRAQELEELPDVVVYGDFGHSTEIVRDTSMTLLLAPGRLSDDNKPISLPFVHLNIDGCSATDDGEEVGKTLLRAMMPFENAAFLLVNLASDLKFACSQLTQMSRAEDLEPRRLELVRQLAAYTTHEALNCINLIDSLLEPEKDEEAPPPRPRPAGSKRLRVKKKASTAKKPEA